MTTLANMPWPLRAYKTALKIDQSFSIGWFSLGTATYFLGNYKKALEAFRICERTFKGDSIDYNEQGLPWTLDRIRVKFNILHTELRRDNKQHGATPGPQCALNRLSAGIIFGTKTISGGGKLIEPQAGAEVKPLSVAHRKPGRSATARAGNWRKQLPFPTAQGRLGRSATTLQAAIPRKPPSTPGESGAVAGTPEPFAAPQNWENQPFDN